ncbi:MAG: hypothetical protein WC657_09445 [Candidatus Paceibacterota bacterium]|jgi:hypothetical protein
MAERDDKGRFIKGNKASPGRAPKEREERYYEITLSAVTFEDWQAIIKKAAEQARRGDAVARKFLADYLIGTAQQKLDVTTNGENINSTAEVTGVNYRAAIANLAPRSMADSESSGEGEDTLDGQEMG